MFGLHRAVSWRASTSQEKADIERVFGTGLRIHTAINLRIGISSESANRENLSAGDQHSRSLIFFSRIVPKKERRDGHQGNGASER
jgi:hypothetical protein